jgi:hypothetical protein
MDLNHISKHVARDLAFPSARMGDAAPGEAFYNPRASQDLKKLFTDQQALWSDMTVLVVRAGSISSNDMYFGRRYLPCSAEEYRIFSRVSECV